MNFVKTAAFPGIFAASSLPPLPHDDRAIDRRLENLHRLRSELILKLPQRENLNLPAYGNRYAAMRFARSQSESDHRAESPPPPQSPGSPHTSRAPQADTANTPVLQNFSRREGIRTHIGFARNRYRRIVLTTDGLQVPLGDKQADMSTAGRVIPKAYRCR
jgi:hypothetical protein